MKIGLFSDPHYSSREVTCGKRYNSRSLGKIREAYEHFQAEGCELVICLGDLIDTESTVEKEIENLSQIAEIIQGSLMPTVCLMGNHDAFVLTSEQFYSTLGTEPPKDMHIAGRDLIFLDGCYFKSGRHYAPGDPGSSWTDTFFPYADELKEKLNNVSGQAYIFIHQNIDPSVKENHRLCNSEEIFDIIDQSGVVKIVFQGHYHAGKSSEYNGIQYVTLPAMCENENAFWIFEL